MGIQHATQVRTFAKYVVTVGTTVDGEPFVACHVCVFPVCRPCYEYERKDGNQSCPQCKTKYKRHKGSPPVQGEEMDDVDLNDVAKNVTQPLRIREEKHKSVGRTLSWDSYSQGEDVAPPKHDKEPGLSNMPYLVSGRSVSGDLSAASPEHLSFASPYSRIRGKGNIRIIDPTRESGSSGFGNVAWRERIDGWKMKPEKSVGAMGVSHAPYEGRGVDFDASTDVVMDDSLL